MSRFILERLLDIIREGAGRGKENDRLDLFEIRDDYDYGCGRERRWLEKGVKRG